MNIFPFKVRAYDNGNYIVLPWQRRSVFTKYKPEGVSWYAYDVEIISKTHAKFTVYGMKCSVYGGIGRVTDEFECNISEDDSIILIERRINSIAERQEKREYELARSIRRQKIKDQLMQELDNVE